MQPQTLFVSQFDPSCVKGFDFLLWFSKVVEINLKMIKDVEQQRIELLMLQIMKEM